MWCRQMLAVTIPCIIQITKGIIEDSKTWGFVVPGLRRVGVGACALASDLLMGKVPAIVRCLSDYDVWNKESGLGWDTVVAVQYALRSKIRLNVLIALSYLYDHFKEDMKDNEVDLIFYDLAKEGRAIINYMAGKNEQEVSACSFEAYVDEVKVVAMNTTEFSSNVYVTWERCEKEVYVMGEICEKEVYVMGERGERGLCDDGCDDGYEKKCLCNGRDM